MTTDSIKQELDDVYATLSSDHEREYFLIHRVRYAYVLQKIYSLQLPAGARILDIGTYPQHLFTILAQHGYHMQGVASTHESVKKKNVAIVDIEKDTLPFADGSFDCVLFFEVMEHLLLNPAQYMKEFYRVLAPGGRLLLTTPNAVHIKNRVRTMVGLSSSFPLFQLFETKTFADLYYRHNREFTMQEAVEIVRRAGFFVQDACRFNAYTPFRKRFKPESPLIFTGKIIGSLLTLLHPSLQDTIYIEGVKNI